ncbi:hypothetical protein ACFL00_03125 [Pseudomonadota bacterium]
MKNLISIGFVSLILAGCHTDSDRENACAEIHATKVMDSAKRMEILKSYGYEPVQAAVFEDALMKLQPLVASANKSDNDDDTTCLVVGGLDCEGILKNIDAGKSKLEIISLDDFLGCKAMLAEIDRPKREAAAAKVAAAEAEKAAAEAEKAAAEAEAATAAEVKRQAERLACVFEAEQKSCECTSRESPNSKISVGYSRCKRIAELNAGR